MYCIDTVVGVNRFQLESASLKKEGLATSGSRLVESPSAASRIVARPSLHLTFRYFLTTIFLTLFKDLTWLRLQKRDEKEACDEMERGGLRKSSCCSRVVLIGSDEV